MAVITTKIIKIKQNSNYTDMNQNDNNENSVMKQVINISYNKISNKNNNDDDDDDDDDNNFM